MIFGGAINGGISLFQKTPKNGPTNNKFALKGLNVGSNIVGGATGAIPMSIVNTATSKMSNKLANKYSQQDNKFNWGHAGMIALPTVAGGIYGLGAITHSMKMGDKILQSKNLKEAGKNVLKSMNPLDHIKTGVTETKNSLKKLFSLRKVGLGGRFMGALNLVGIGAMAIPAVYSYASRTKAKEDNRLPPAAGYADDVLNAATAATAKGPVQFMKTAAYIPVFTNLMKYRDAMSRAKEIARSGGQTLAARKKLIKLQEQADKSLKNAGYDALGVAAIGVGGKIAYNKWKQNRENSMNPELRSLSSLIR